MTKHLRKNCLCCFYILAAFLLCISYNAAAQSLPCYNTDNATKQIAKSIATATKSNQIQSIAVMTFQTNGGRSDALTSQIRSIILEELINSYSSSLQIFDREDSKAVATESGFSLDGVQLSSSQAILVGEIFSVPGDNIGYISYRLFRATDTAILNAGFIPVQWNPEETSQLNGSVSTASSGTLPYIKQDDVQSLVTKMTRLRNVGIAIGQSGANSVENTLHQRMAYAQMIPALLQSGIRLHEREFFIFAATEASLNEDVAMPAQVKAIAQLKSTGKSKNTYKYKLQVSAIPQGNLLYTANFSQVAGTSSDVTTSQQRHNDENAFDNFMDQLDNEYRDIKLIYKCEVYITDDYEIPEKYQWKEGYEDGGLRNYNISYNEYNAVEGKQPVKTAFIELAKNLYKKTNGDRKQISKTLTSAAILGYSSDSPPVLYMGPLFLCYAEALQKIELASSHYHFDNVVANGLSDLYEKPTRKGEFSYKDIKFRYKTSVKWKDGLPWKVTAQLDFSPMKDKLIKRK